MKGKGSVTRDQSASKSTTATLKRRPTILISMLSVRNTSLVCGEWREAVSFTSHPLHRYVGRATNVQRSLMRPPGSETYHQPIEPHLWFVVFAEQAQHGKSGLKFLHVFMTTPMNEFTMVFRNHGRRIECFDAVCQKSTSALITLGVAVLLRGENTLPHPHPPIRCLARESVATQQGTSPG